MESTEKKAALPKMSSYFNQELQISLEAPSGWSAGKTDDFELLLIGEPENKYRANLGINVRSLETASQAELEKIIRETQRSQAANLNGFRQSRDQTLMVDNRPAYIRFYEWRDQSLGLQFSQLQALILVTEDTVYTVDGSSLKELEDKYLPILEHMVHSIRFIPINE